MSQPELLKKVVAVLEDAGIGYMLTGSIASSLQGIPRATHDIDFVIDIEAGNIKDLAAEFTQPAFFFDEAAAINAIKAGDMFNLVEVESGIKIDFWPLTGDAFDRSRFGRRQAEEIMGIRVMVSSPEDTILMKLRWAKMSGGSEKQFQDALRVYEIQAGILDVEYMKQWAAKIGVAELLAGLMEKAEI